MGQNEDTARMMREIRAANNRAAQEQAARDRETLRQAQERARNNG